MKYRKLDPWTTTSHEVVLDTPWFRIHKQHMRTPDGAETDFYIDDHGDSAICVCVNEDLDILIERQFRPAIERVSIDYPAGRMESDDASAEAAIRREMLEEAGFTATSLTKLGTVDKDPGWSKSRLHVFLARGHVDQETAPDSTEGIVSEFVSPDTILDLIDSGQMACSFCITATFLAFQKLGTPISK